MYFYFEGDIISVISEIITKYAPQTMKNGSGVNLTPPKLFTLKEILFNFCHSFKTIKVQGDKCLEEYLKQEIPLSLIYRKLAFVRRPGTN